MILSWYSTNDMIFCVDCGYHYFLCEIVIHDSVLFCPGCQCQGETRPRMEASARWCWWCLAGSSWQPLSSCSDPGTWGTSVTPSLLTMYYALSLPKQLIKEMGFIKLCFWGLTWFLINNLYFCIFLKNNNKNICSNLLASFWNVYLKME